MDEVAALYRDLKSLFEELSEEQQPVIQQSAIAEKVALYRDRCYSAFCHLGEERNKYEQKIKSLQNEIQGNPVTQGKCTY